METIGAYEAKTHLPKLLERVSKGERIMITKHGVPVAILLPPDFQSKTDPRQTIERLRKFRNKHRLNGLNLRKMIEEGRR